MKDLYVWLFTCVLSAAITVLILATGLQGENDPLWVEVAGTTLGFALVISFERTFTLLGEQEKGSELAQALGKELGFNLLILRDDKLIRGSTQAWEMGLSTGDISFIESSKRGMFDAVYEIITRRNVLVDRYDTARIATGTDSKALDELRALIADGFTEPILEKIPETLKETMSKKWMEAFSKFEKEPEKEKSLVNRH